ncbi:DNA excision repair protein Ercc1 [Rhodnius prolixus]|uniref:DNA excision repair protein ERCC-1 n=2 Tax=Rhodnius TaxID=13248 RepID=R4G7V1_RHOPR
MTEGPSSKVLLLEGSADDSGSSSASTEGNLKVIVSGNKGNAILVNPCQKGNPLLKHISSVPWEFEEGIVPDYILGRTTCALFLSLRYFTLKPDYINDRLKSLGKLYDLRVLLVQVDMKDPYHALKHLTRICLLTDMTLMLAWSPEEAGKIIETYKIFEHKPPDLIMEKTESDIHNKMVAALTSIRAVNKTDASTLLANFGSLEKMIKASTHTLSNCPGLGMRKAKNINKILHTPFLKSEKMPNLGIAKYFSK